METPDNSGNPSAPKSTGGQLIPPDALRLLLQTQQQKVLNDAQEIALRGKELEVNKELALKSMELDGRVESQRHSENRKTFTRLGYILGGFAILAFVFIGYCLNIGKEKFLLDLLRLSLYPILMALSYWVGRRSKGKKSKNEPTIPDAEVMDH